MSRFAFAFTAYLYSRDPPVVIARIFAWAVDQQVLFLIDQILAVKFSHLEVGR